MVGTRLVSSFVGLSMNIVFITITSISVNLCTNRPILSFNLEFISLGNDVLPWCNENTFERQLRIVLLKTALNITYKNVVGLNTTFTTVLKTGLSLVTPRNRTRNIPYYGTGIQLMLLGPIIVGAGWSVLVLNIRLIISLHIIHFNISKINEITKAITFH